MSASTLTQTPERRNIKIPAPHVPLLPAEVDPNVILWIANSPPAELEEFLQSAFQRFTAAARAYNAALNAPHIAKPRLDAAIDGLIDGPLNLKLAEARRRARCSLITALEALVTYIEIATDRTESSQ